MKCPYIYHHMYEYNCPACAGKNLNSPATIASIMTALHTLLAAALEYMQVKYVLKLFASGQENARQIPSNYVHSNGPNSSI